MGTSPLIESSRLLRRLGGLFLCIALTTAVAHADWQMGMQEPASDMAETQRELNAIMMWIIVVIGVGVFGAMLYSIVYHRKSRGHQAANFHESTAVEIVWTIVPMLIIIAMALPATSAILAYKDTGEPDITIKVTGYQWKWSYDYLNEGVSFYSQLSTPPEEIGGKYYNSDASANPTSDHYLLEVDQEVVVPVGKKVRLLLTAGDVIHAWWVPQLGVKQDAIPGLVRDAWFVANREGTYRGQCAELCGKNHAFMPIVVRAVGEEEYAAWLDERRSGEAVAADEGPVFASQAQVAASTAADEAPVEWNMEQAMKQGEAAYGRYCAACHQANGEGLAPTFPALKGAAIAVEEGMLASHIDIVLNGKAGTSMAAFNYLSDADLAGVITYERNAWGNDAGSLVTPDDIKTARQ